MSPTATERTLDVGAVQLPPEAVTQTFVIFGKRGGGKTNTAVVLAEEMFPIAPFVVLDPIGAWWGLKSNFDGSGPGLAVYVFGGEHGDLPLEPAAGRLMADVFVQHRIPMVLDMKGWTGADRARFVTDFALQLLATNGRVPVHVFIEEADAFVPQRPYKGEERMLGAMDRLVRWGRQEGIGATLITQRSAKANKDVTTQAETLIAHRTTGPQDRDAIDAWIRYHAGGEERQQILHTLPTLPDGTAWVWSPEWLELLRQVSFRRRRTFDSASTPKVGEKRPEPKRLADVDLDRLRGQLATSIQKAKADDPMALRRRIVDLEKELQTARKDVRTEVQRVEVAVLDHAAVRRIQAAVEEWIREQSRVLLAGVDDVVAAAIATEKEGSDAARPSNHAHPRGGTPTPRRAAPDRPAAPRHQDTPPGPAAEPAIGRAKQRILDALAELEAIGLAPASRAQVAFFAGYTPNSGGFNNYLGSLRSAGLIDYPGGGQVALTGVGRAAANPALQHLSTEQLQRAVFDKVGPAKTRILEALIAAYPGALSREEVAEAAGYTANSGGFNNYLGALRTLGVIDYPGRGRVVAADVLFLGSGA